MSHSVDIPQGCPEQKALVLLLHPHQIQRRPRVKSRPGKIPNRGFGAWRTNLRFPRPDTKRNRSYSDKVYAFLRTQSFRLLNDLFKSGSIHESNEASWLADVLYEYSTEKGSSNLISSYDQGHGGKGKTGLTHESLWRLCQNAAKFVLSKWDPEFIMDRIEAARAGGRASKRKPKYLPSLLDGLDHLSKSQQAKHLGISTATVARLRRKKKALDESNKPGNTQPAEAHAETRPKAPVEGFSIVAEKHLWWAPVARIIRKVTFSGLVYQLRT